MKAEAAVISIPRFQVEMSPFAFPSQPFVHVWLLDCRQLADKALSAHLELLSPSEQARAQQFKRNQRDFLATRIMMRLCLAQYLEAAPGELIFAANAAGKPFLPDHKLQFNLSHSGGLAALAVSDCEIGVDIEALRQRNYLSIAKNFFHPNEYAELQTKAPHELAPWFFRYWTLKEAFVKATGGGIVTGLEKINFDLTCEPICLCLSAELDEQPDSWRFLQQPITPNCWLALACRTSDLPSIKWHCAAELFCGDWET